MRKIEVIDNYTTAAWNKRADILCRNQGKREYKTK